MIEQIFFHLPWSVIFNKAAKYDIDPMLMASIIVKESHGKPCPQRYEPEWKYFYELSFSASRAGTTVETERIGQMTSWGMLQIVGATARSLGFIGAFPELCEPHIGIEYGCAYLRKKMETNKTIEQSVAAYNSGTPKYLRDGKFVNQKYVDDIMRVFESLKDIRELLRVIEPI